MMRNLNNIWVDINLKNYKNKELENDFILLQFDIINFLQNIILKQNLKFILLLFENIIEIVKN